MVSELSDDVDGSSPLCTLTILVAENLYQHIVIKAIYTDVLHSMSKVGNINLLLKVIIQTL